MESRVRSVNTATCLCVRCQEFLSRSFMPHLNFCLPLPLYACTVRARTLKGTCVLYRSNDAFLY